MMVVVVVVRLYCWRVMAVAEHQCDGNSMALTSHLHMRSLPEACHSFGTETQ
jgi:hypothetical protein